MKHFIQHLLKPKFVAPIALLVFSAIIVVANYTPGTFLTGWDTLHPEFNFGLSFQRILNGVWRQDQGLGTVAIQSHMAELPRVVILWILSFVAPLNMLRYITMLTPLIIGTLGVYFLALYTLSNKKFRYPSSFLAGLVYLCNLGTVQQFIVPLEMFAFHYAFLPWTILFALKFLDTGTFKKFLAFFLVSILIVPQAHTATLFYAYLLGFLATLSSYALFHRSKNTLKRAGILLLSILIINAYWLLPNIYAAVTQGTEVHNSRINRFFSDEAFAKNQVYGNPIDGAIIKNFLFDWQLYDVKTNGAADVLGPWITHFKNPVVLVFGYLVFFVSLFGFIYSLYKREKKVLIFMPLTIISSLMLLNGTFPMTYFFDLLSQVSSTLKEALRFPFTKFSILYMLGLSIYFGYGISTLFSIFKKKALVYACTLALLIGFTYYFSPAFTGNLVQPAMRVSIPKDYFEMFSWFQKQPETDRVAILPIHSFWGWVYYSWGYQGAGFLQFGIPQPLMDRDHDRWSKYNEQYTREMHYAIYNQDPKLIENVLAKYNVRWILFDDSVLNVSGSKNETLDWYIPTLLKDSKKIKLVKTFGKNIKIYEFQNKQNLKGEVLNHLPDIGPNALGYIKDPTYSQVGTYITNKEIDRDNQKNSIVYDERFIGTTRNVIEYTVNAYSKLSSLEDCSQGRATFTRTAKGVIHYTSTNGPLCDHFTFPDLPHNKSYVLEITSRNIEGFPLQVYICNNLTLHCNQTFHLNPSKQFVKERFIIPTYDDHGVGQTINVNNFTINKRTSVNEISEISLREYTPEKALIRQNKGTISQEGKLVFSQPGKAVINFTKPLKHNDIVTYDERFHSGWKAYLVHPKSQLETLFPFFFGHELTKHVPVNNWANGWMIKDEDLNKGSQVIILFLPQYLEYGGFILLALTVITIGILILKKWTVDPRKHIKRSISHRFKHKKSF